MTDILIFILGLGLCVQAFIGLTFFISSIREREKRASVLGGFQLLGMLVLVILFFILNACDFFDSGVGFGIMILALIIGVAAVILLFSRIGVNPKALQGTKGLIVGEVNRWDERDIQFSNMMRMMYMMTKMMPPPPGPPGPGDQPGQKDPTGSPPGGDEMSFTAMADGPPPEMFKMMKNITDEEMNASGLGPLGPADNIGVIDGAGAAPNAAMMNASAVIPMNWATPDKYSPPLGKNKISMSPEEASVRVKGFTKNLGVVSVGITEIDPNWIYTRRGVSGLHLKEWGKEVKLDHKYAIVFTEEMAFETVAAGPHTPIIVESMKNYAKGAFIGAQLANFIANMGYSARANHMSSYDGLLVPMAVNAGLGELGRLGYLITKKFGPRVRLGAVTTDLPLVPDKPVDIGVRHFCMICKKCAHCCPSRSIPLYDDPVEVNGSLRWKLDDESCFMYWQKVGTDCGVCMRVCPWAHDRTFPHKIIVEAVSRNKFARILFHRMDDIFYGKKPKPKAPPEWANFRTSLISRPPTKEEISMISGSWKLTVETPLGTDNPMIIFREEDGVLRGSMDGKMGKPELEDIRIDGTNFSFKAAVKSPMGTMKLDFSGAVDGKKIAGNFFSPMGPTPFTGEKQVK